MRIDTETFTELCVDLAHLSDAWLSVVGAVARTPDTSTAFDMATRLMQPMTDMTARIDRLQERLRAVLQAQEPVAPPPTVQ